MGEPRTMMWVDFERCRDTFINDPTPNPVVETATVSLKDLRDLLRAQEVAAEAAIMYETEQKLPDVRHISIWRQYAQDVETRLRRQIDQPFEAGL